MTASMGLHGVDSAPGPAAVVSLGQGTKRPSGRKVDGGPAHPGHAGHGLHLGDGSGAGHGGHDDELVTAVSTRLTYWRSTSLGGLWVEALDVIASVTSCMVYIVYTYEAGAHGQHDMPPWSREVEYTFSALFAAYWLLECFSAKSVLHYVASWQSLIDLTTLAPVTVAGDTLAADQSFWVKFARLCRVLRFLHLRRAQRLISSDIKQQLFSIGFTVTFMTFVAASFTHLVENTQSLWPAPELVDIKHVMGITWFDSFWMCCISFLTVGYGDYVPQTTPGRLAILLTLILEFLLIPQQTNRLVTLLSRQSEWVRSTYSGSSSATHIVVTGALNVNGADTMDGPITTFFAEYFDEDHGNSQNRYAVLLAKGQPSREIQLLLAQPSLSLALTYIDGAVMAGKDLQRCGILTAKAAFVLCDKFADRIDEEDSQTILRALSIKRFVWEQCERDIPVYVQLIRPENKQLFITTMMSHLRYAAAQLQNNARGDTQKNCSLASDEPTTDAKLPGSVRNVMMLGYSSVKGKSGGASQKSFKFRDKQAREDSFGSAAVNVSERIDSLSAVGLPSAASLSDSAVCVQEIKLNLLAKSCLCPGLTTLVHNLVMSHNGEDNDSDPAEGEDGNWSKEYSDGCEYEIYRVSLPPVYEGLTFTEVSDIIHTECNMVLFALELDIANGRLPGGPRIVLNPGSFVLPAPPFKLHGFVIASDKREAEVISQVGARSRKKSGSSSGSLSTPSSGSVESSGASVHGLSGPSLRVGASEGPATAAGEQTAAVSIKLAIDSLKARKRAAEMANKSRVEASTSRAERGATEQVEKPGVLQLPSVALQGNAVAINVTEEPVSRVTEDRDKGLRIRAGVTTSPSRQRASSATADRSSSQFLNTIPSLKLEEAAAPAELPGVALPSHEGLSGDEPEGLNSVRRWRVSGDLTSALPRLDTGVSAHSALSPTAKAARSAPKRGRSASTHVADMTLEVEEAIKSKKIRRHIIVCTCDYSNLSSFVAPLRASYLSDHMAVIVLHPEPPSTFEWNKTLRYEGVYYMQGSPFEANDLVRAGIMTASSVVLFQLSRSQHHSSNEPHGGHAAGGEGHLDPNNSDAMYICIYRLIRTLQPDVDIVCEIAARSNISYLANYSASAVDDGGVFSSPPFAAGHVFAPDLLDLLLAQAYYNHHLITILTHLVSGGAHAASRNRSWLGRISELGYEKDVAGLADSQIYLVAVPKHYHGLNFGELYTALALDHGIVCLGMRRAGQAQIKPKTMLKDMGSAFFSFRRLSVGRHSSNAGPSESGTPASPVPSSPEYRFSGLLSPRASANRDANLGPSVASQGGSFESLSPTDVLVNTLPYVYTNPARRTCLHKGDKIFVLSHKDPSATLSAMP